MMGLPRSSYYYETKTRSGLSDVELRDRIDKIHLELPRGLYGPGPKNVHLKAY